MAETRVLIVEDEEKLLTLIKATLAEHFEVTAIGSHQELQELLEKASFPYDIVVLDRMMNGRDTVEVVSTLKSKFPQSQVLILSAINTPTEKAMSLDRGADDYLSKPFENEELVARVRALGRRAPSEVRFGNLAIDVISRSASVEGKTVTLTNKEYLLIWTLIRHPHRIFNKAALYQDVWQSNADIESNAIETTVNKLRRKLEEAGASISIRNSRNIGYWIEE